MRGRGANSRLARRRREGWVDGVAGLGCGERFSAFEMPFSKFSPVTVKGDEMSLCNVHDTNLRAACGIYGIPANSDRPILKFRLSCKGALVNHIVIHNWGSSFLFPFK